MDKKSGAKLAGALGVLALAYVLLKRKMNKPETFISEFGGAAKVVANEYQLPTWLMLTQAAHESAYGLSALALKAKNLFGFTGNSWKAQGKLIVDMPTREFLNGVWVALTRPFRAYPTYADSMRDYARLLTTQPRYADVVAKARAGDVNGAFQALTKAGYATDPIYGDKLASVYKALKNYIV